MSFGLLMEGIPFPENTISIALNGSVHLRKVKAFLD